MSCPSRLWKIVGKRRIFIGGKSASWLEALRDGWHGWRPRRDEAGAEGAEAGQGGSRGCGRLEAGAEGVVGIV